MKTTLTFLALGLATISGIPANAAEDSYSGTLYRNGGYFGLANSDTSLEQAQTVIAGAPSSEAAAPEVAQTAAWNGTLHGMQKSDAGLEFDP
jgi:hypothetical protein